MEAASVCMGLLAMAQTDHATSELPRGPERSAMFVQKAEEYFKGLNVSWDALSLSCSIVVTRGDRSTDEQTIQSGIRASLARVRASKIAVGSLKAPEANAIPQTLGSGAPSQGDDRPAGSRGAGLVGRGALQEGRVAGEAWTRLAETVECLVTLEGGENGENAGAMDGSKDR